MASHSITQFDSTHRNAQHSSSRRTRTCLKKANMTCVHSSLPRYRIKVPWTPATGVCGPGWSHRLVPPRIAGVVRDSLALHCRIHGCGSLCLLQWHRQSQTPVKRAQCSTQQGRHVKRVHVRQKRTAAQRAAPCRQAPCRWAPCRAQSCQICDAALCLVTKTFVCRATAQQRVLMYLCARTAAERLLSVSGGSEVCVCGGVGGLGGGGGGDTQRF
jgi:hypothetical protein